ncbi:MAG: septum formation initiator family protein [Myxococcota bacterium]
MARRRQVVWAAVIVALVLAGGSAVAEGGFRRYWRLKKDVETLEARNAKLSQDNVRLRREVDALRDDARALERAAREELGYVRPGELVFDVEER